MLTMQGQPSHTSLELAGHPGSPISMLLSQLTTLAAPHGALLLTILAEIAALIAIVSVYHFCRKDTLPQTAERATWLFALSPLLLVDFGAESLGACLGLLALSSAVHGRMLLGTVAALVATWCMPSVGLITPALLALAMRSRHPDTPYWAPWMLGLAPLIGVITLVFASFLLAGMGDVSLRSLTANPAHTLRSLESLQGGIMPTAGDALFLLGLSGAIACAWRFADNTPGSWAMLTIPLMCWPLIHEHALHFAPLAILAVPLCAWTAKLCEDPARERPLLATCTILSMLCLTGL